MILIDTRLKKVVDFEIIQKSKGKVKGNYLGSSNGMEVEALRRLIPRWTQNTLVVGCVHDSDSKASKAIRDARWHIEQFYDPNHLSKSFDRKWAKVPHAHLRGLQMKIRKWFNFLIRSDFSPEEKVTFWSNTTQHFIGNHDGCPPHKIKAQKRPPLAENPVGQDELNQFLDKTKKLIVQWGTGLNTQLCECFNSVKARYADKTTSWKISWDARVMCAILQMNNPEKWKFELFAECGLPELHEEALHRLHERVDARLRTLAVRRSDQASAKARKARARSRADDKKDTTGSDDYRFTPSRSLADDMPGSASPPNETPQALESSRTPAIPPDTCSSQLFERWEDAKIRLDELPEGEISDMNPLGRLASVFPSAHMRAPCQTVSLPLQVHCAVFVSYDRLPPRLETDELVPRRTRISAQSEEFHKQDTTENEEVEEIVRPPINDESHTLLVEQSNVLILQATSGSCPLSGTPVTDSRRSDMDE
jgi:hypothetical protein